MDLGGSFTGQPVYGPLGRFTGNPVVSGVTGPVDEPPGRLMDHFAVLWNPQPFYRPLGGLWAARAIYGPPGRFMEQSVILSAFPLGVWASRSGVWCTRPVYGPPAHLTGVPAVLWASPPSYGPPHSGYGPSSGHRPHARGSGLAGRFMGHAPVLSTCRPVYGPPGHFINLSAVRSTYRPFYRPPAVLCISLPVYGPPGTFMGNSASLWASLAG